MPVMGEKYFPVFVKYSQSSFSLDFKKDSLTFLTKRSKALSLLSDIMVSPFL